MTDTRTYDVNGATLTVTIVLYRRTIEIKMTLDINALDAQEPDHSAHNLMLYVADILPQWERPESYWWCKLRRRVMCKTGAQARRIVQHAITHVSDAVSTALLDRDRRKAEMAVALSA